MHTTRLGYEKTRIAWKSRVSCVKGWIFFKVTPGNRSCCVWALLTPPSLLPLIIMTMSSEQHTVCLLRKCIVVWCVCLYRRCVLRYARGVKMKIANIEFAFRMESKFTSVWTNELKIYTRHVYNLIWCIASSITNHLSSKHVFVYITIQWCTKNRYKL